MNSPLTRASAGAPLRRRIRLKTVLALGVTVVLSGMAIPAAAAPAAAAVVPAASTLLADGIETEIHTIGWPAGAILAGEEFTVTMAVESLVLGSPSLEGQVVGIGYAGEMVALGALDESGFALLTVRPLTTGPLELTPFFAGDATFAPLSGAPRTVTVAEVPLSVELIFDTSYGVPTTFGGSVLPAIAAVTTACADAAVTDAEEEACAARYGSPSGTLVLTRDGTEIERIAVPGSDGGQQFAASGEALGDGVNAERVFTFTSRVQDILLGAPASQLYEVTFVSDNWFGPAQQSVVAELRAASTSVEIFVGDDLLDPQHAVFADRVTLVAFVSVGELDAAALSGTVRFFADGAPISPEVPIIDQVGAAFEWTPSTGSADYAITAVVTPATLNHLASESDAYPLRVVVTPAPNPAPVEDPNPVPIPNPNPNPNQNAAPAHNPAPADALAVTGVGNTDTAGMIGALTAGAGLLLVAVTAFMKRMRRRRRSIPCVRH